jgi:cytochrome P450 family 6
MFVILAICVISVLLYLYGTRRFNYWESKGIKCDKPYPFIGNSFKYLTLQTSFTNFYTYFYKKYPNERFIGTYAANNPMLIVTEPRDIQRVLINDFNTFYPRGIKIDKEDPDPFLKHLFMADGDLWKLLRQRMTPAFTSGKLKAMFPLIVERAEKLQNLAAERAKDNKEVDIKELMARYTTDFIGACGFGIHMDALDDENSVFRKLGNRTFKMTKMDMLKITIKFFMPRLTRNMRSVPHEVSSMTTSLVKSIMEERNYEPTARNDFIDLLLEVKRKGKMVTESIEKKNPDGSPIIVEQELDDELIAAQAFIFFAAGFETSSSTSSYTMHVLAFNQEEQRKCQKEIDEVLQRYDNKLCYDAINEMKYLKMCFK